MSALCPEGRSQAPAATRAPPTLAAAPPPPPLPPSAPSPGELPRAEFQKWRKVPYQCHDSTASYGSDRSALLRDIAKGWAGTLYRANGKPFEGIANDEFVRKATERSTKPISMAIRNSGDHVEVRGSIAQRSRASSLRTCRK